MTLPTTLKHIASETEYKEVIAQHQNVMICCGRMGPMCVPVYQAMTELENRYTHIEFRDMAFDAPDAHVIRNLPECNGFMGLPFTVYYKNGEVIKATSGLQTKDQVQQILDEYFGA